MTESHWKGKAEKGLSGTGAALALTNLGLTSRDFYREVIKKKPSSFKGGRHAALLGGALAAAGGAHALRQRRLKKEKAMNKSAAFEAGVKEAFLGKLLKKKPPLKMKFKGHEAELKKAIKPGKTVDPRGITTTRGSVADPMGGIRKTKQRYVTL